MLWRWSCRMGGAGDRQRPSSLSVVLGGGRLFRRCFLRQPSGPSLSRSRTSGPRPGPARQNTNWDKIELHGLAGGPRPPPAATRGGLSHQRAAPAALGSRISSDIARSGDGIFAGWQGRAKSLDWQNLGAFVGVCSSFLHEIEDVSKYD